MSDSSSKRKGRPPGPPPAGPAPDAPAVPAAEGAADTLILRPGEATDRIRVPREALISPSEATVVLRSGASAERALEQGGPAPGSVDPDATTRLARKDLYSPHEGTMLMATVPPLAPGSQDPVRAVAAEPDTVPGLTPELPSPSDRTELVPVREMLSEVLGGPADRTLVLRAGEPPPPEDGAAEAGAHEGTMLMPAGIPQAPAPEDSQADLVPPPQAHDAGAHEGTMLMPAGIPPAPAPEDTRPDLMPPPQAPDAGAHEGTMLMPAMLPEKAPESASQSEETRPDLVPPAVPEAMRGESPAAPEPPTSPAPETPIVAAPGEATVLTAAEIIRQTFAEAPDAASRTIKVTQGELPELRLPELPELTPAPEPAALEEPDPELPRSTLHMRLTDMPETRALPGRHPGLFPPVPPSDAGPPASSGAPPPPLRDEAVEAPARAAKTAPVQVPPAARMPPAAKAAPARGASLGLWVAVIAGIAVAGGGLWAWNLGWFSGAKPDRPAPPGGSAPPAPPPDPAAAIPEQMRPAYEKALAGDPNAMRYLGVCYVNGLGVPADRAEGLKWYRRAAAAGSAAAQRDLQALEAQGIR